MGGDVLGGVEVLAQQGRRHHQRVAGVGEPLAGGAVLGELARGSRSTPVRSRIVRVYSTLLSRRMHDPARVAGGLVGLEVEIAADPAAEHPAILGLRLAGLRRRHLPLVEHVGDLLPGRHPATGLGHRGEPLEVDVRLGLLAGVALEAEAMDQRTDVLPEFAVEPGRYRGRCPRIPGRLVCLVGRPRDGRHAAQGQQPRRRHGEGPAIAGEQGRPPPGVRSSMVHLGEVPLRGRLGGQGPHPAGLTIIHGSPGTSNGGCSDDLAATIRVGRAVQPDSGPSRSRSPSGWKA